MPRVPKTTWLAELEDATESPDFDDGWDPMAEVRMDYIHNKREAGEPMNRRDLAIEQAGGEELLFADGYDDAIIGVTDIRGDNVVLYDISKILKILESQGMSSDEAVEFFEYNVAGAYMGFQTPIYVHVLDDGSKQ